MDEQHAKDHAKPHERKAHPRPSADGLALHARAAGRRRGLAKAAIPKAARPLERTQRRAGPAGG